MAGCPELAAAEPERKQPPGSSASAHRLRHGGHGRAPRAPRGRSRGRTEEPCLSGWRGHRAGGFAGVQGWLPRIAFLILLQVALGIATLLASVPISLALGHQVLAFMLSGAVIAYLADLRRARSPAPEFR